VFFDLLTIRFLLKYMTRPLHFFGGIGSLGVLSGGGIALWLLLHKAADRAGRRDGEHGPWFIIAAVLILAGIQFIGVGLLGELQVRHFFTQSQRAVCGGPYCADEAGEEQGIGNRE
jgi:hypothetical protein